MLWFFHLMKLLRSPISCSKNTPSLWSHRILSGEHFVHDNIPPTALPTFYAEETKIQKGEILKAQQVGETP